MRYRKVCKKQLFYEGNSGYQLENNIDNLTDTHGWSHKTSLYKKYFDSASTRLGATETPEISIIMISWKDNPTLKKALESASRQENVKKEIIFVNNGAGNSLDWCKEYADIYIKLKSNTGAYLPRNIGALFSSAEVLLFLEDDGISDPFLAYNHFNVHTHMPEIISTRGVCFPATASRFNKEQNHYYLGEKVVPSIPNLEGNSAFKKEHFMSVYGWDDDIQFGHGGLDIASRLYEKYAEHRRFIYIPHAVLIHDYALTESSLINKKKKQIKGMEYLLSKNPSVNYINDITREDYEEISVPQIIKNAMRHTQLRISEKIKSYEESRKEIIGQRDNYKFEIIKNTSIAGKIYAVGAGSLGERFAGICKRNGIEVSCFFDKNSGKLAMNGFRVASDININERCVVIITTSYVDSALKDLEHIDANLIDQIFIFK